MRILTLAIVFFICQIALASTTLTIEMQDDIQLVNLRSTNSLRILTPTFLAVSDSNEYVPAVRAEFFNGRPRNVRKVSFVHREGAFYTDGDKLLYKQTPRSAPLHIATKAFWGLSGWKLAPGVEFNVNYRRMTAARPTYKVHAEILVNK